VRGHSPGDGDLGISGSLVDKGSFAIDVTLLSEPFPFEVHLLDSLGLDILAKHLKPVTTTRRAASSMLAIHLDAGSRKTFSVTLRGYLDSRGIPPIVERAVKLRLAVAASTDGSRSFSVVYSNAVDLAPKHR
jgi:hypothetical protein